MFAVAPMMDWTDRHCRSFHRVLSRTAVLYSEMVTADAVIHGDRERLLGFSDCDGPVVLQLGGSDPGKLADAARIGARFGYDETNLNVGCPSDRVQSGAFGACLMREPALVAECLSAMRAAAGVPVSIKHRLGVDEQDAEKTLFPFVETVAASGVTTFVVHARKAILKGLSPKDNRTIPPLDYGLVRRMKAAFPKLTVILNGGLADLDSAEAEMTGLDGVMLGRAAYQTPSILLGVDGRFAGAVNPHADPLAALNAWRPYVANQLDAGIGLHAMTRHILGLFHGQPGGRLFRRVLSEKAPRRGAGLDALDEALDVVVEAGRRAHGTRVARD
jgi:tRNA-dihydrouridine synthase A